MLIPFKIEVNIIANSNVLMIRQKFIVIDQAPLHGPRTCMDRHDSVYVCYVELC